MICLRREPSYVLQLCRIFLQVDTRLMLHIMWIQSLFDDTNVPRYMKGITIHRATGTKRSNTNTRPVQRNASVKQTTIKAPYGKSPGCTTSCGLRLPRKTEVTAARLIKHLGCKFAKGLRLVVTRKKKRSPPSKVSASSSSGRSKPSIIPIINDSHRSEAIEDCIQFINSSSSFTRSNSTS